MNNYWKSLERLGFVGTQMSTELNATPVPYGVTVAQAAELDTALSNFVDARTAVENKRAELRAAVEEQNAFRDALINNMGFLAKNIYNNPSVTPAMIALLGLEPRDTSNTSAIPYTPTSFEATPNADGSVKLSWNRNGNSSRAVFIVEQKDAGGEWSIFTTTTKTRETHFGFAPGEEKWFRVYASINGQVSAPSFEDSIYTAAPSAPTVSLAA
ncbi:MAG TPA: fibronectin type III domain-containing protein [Fimbriimonadaceae bacterium]|nr:fibronectin type III domain-containing protein [Fimbriimonadaceae bacterium]